MLKIHNPKKPVLFFGEALIDTFYDAEGNRTHTLPGGGILNAAVAASRLDLPVAFAGSIADDEGGKMLLDVMKREKINTEHVIVREGMKTACSEIRLTPTGVPEFKFDRRGCADEMFTVEDALKIDPRKYSALHCGGVMLTTEPAATAQGVLLAAFVEAGVPVSFDMNVRRALITGEDEDDYRRRLLDFVVRANLFKGSYSDIEFLFPGGDINDSFSDIHCARMGRMTVLTIGVQGSLIASGQACERIFAYNPEKIVDTTGCGDAFAAGLLRGLAMLGEHKRWDMLTIEETQTLGSTASIIAARCCEKRGGIDGMPYFNEIYRFAKK